jgi:hypothetical protein
MGKKIFLTFGNNKYYNSLYRINNEALSFNIFDEVLIFTDIKLRNDFPQFWETHENFINNNPRGYGYWIWKSFLTLKILEKMNENDILVYVDAGCSLNTNGIQRLNDYFQIVRDSNNGILSFELPFSEKCYTKMDAFEYLGMNNNEILDSKQLVGGIYILRKCDKTTFLFNEVYNNISNNYNLINDCPSTLENNISFVEHRHDQSIFSLLRKKYGTEILYDETYFSDDCPIEHINKFPIRASRLM